MVFVILIEAKCGFCSHLLKLLWFSGEVTHSIALKTSLIRLWYPRPRLQPHLQPCWTAFEQFSWSCSQFFLIRLCTNFGPKSRSWSRSRRPPIWSIGSRSIRTKIGWKVLNFEFFLVPNFLVCIFVVGFTLFWYLAIVWNHNQIFNAVL